MGWEHLIIRPGTKLSPADKRRVEKAVRRAKREGKIARTAQQTIPYEEMYQDGVCRITSRLFSKSVMCEDINYAKASDDEKAVLFELYCKSNVDSLLNIQKEEHQEKEKNQEQDR